MLVEIEIRGTSPLLMHRMTDDEVLKLLQPKMKKMVAADLEWTPRELAEQRVYRDKNGRIVIPASFLVGSFRDAASDFRQTDRGRKTMKHIAHVIFRPQSEFSPLLNVGGGNATEFEVDIRPTVNRKSNSAVVVCRPRFDEWGCVFRSRVDTDLCSEAMAQRIFTDAGIKFGIGSFRKGGFGQFRIARWKEVKE